MMFAGRVSLLLHSSYPKRNKREALPYWEDIDADMSLCLSRRSYCRVGRALAQIELRIIIK